MECPPPKEGRYWTRFARATAGSSNGRQRHVLPPPRRLTQQPGLLDAGDLHVSELVVRPSVSLPALVALAWEWAACWRIPEGGGLES